MIESNHFWIDKAVQSDGPQFTRSEGERKGAFYYARVNDMHWPEGGLVSVASKMCWIDMILTNDRYDRSYDEGRAGAATITGPIFFAPPGTRVRHRWRQPRLRTLTCLFDPNRLISLTPFDWDWDARSLNRVDGTATARLQRHMLLLAEELRAPGFASDIQIESLLTLLACELRTLTGMAERLTQADRLTEHEMRTVREAVQQSGASLSLRDVAAALDLGPRQFSAMFKATSGQTFRSYVADSRMRLARMLLKDSDLLIKQVAYRCGFKGTAAFTAAFHQAVGVSPVGYRGVEA